MIDSQTKLIGLIGHPVSHSKSPQMHNAMFKQLGLNYRYISFDVFPDDLEEAIKGVKALGIRGLNVTIPHKIKVMSFLDKISDEAVAIGAVNTIVNDNGFLIGYNTDGEGYVRSLIEETNVDLKGKRVLILGAGGAARAISYTLAKYNIEALIISNRTKEKGEEIKNLVYQKQPIEIITIEANQINDVIPNIDIIINTTSIGMSPNIDEIPFHENLIQNGQIISDIIYNPLETKLIKAAKLRNAITHTGLGMFIYQGVVAFERWTKISPDAKIMRQAVLEAMN